MVVFSRRHIAELTCHFHVGGALRKAHGHVVSLEAHRGANVFHVLAGQGRGSQTATLLVDALVIGQLTAELDRGVHRFAAHSVYR